MYFVSYILPVINQPGREQNDFSHCKDTAIRELFFTVMYFFIVTTHSNGSTLFHSQYKTVSYIWATVVFFKPLIALELNGSYIVTYSGTRDYFLPATFFPFCMYAICIFKNNPDWDFNVYNLAVTHCSYVPKKQLTYCISLEYGFVLFDYYFNAVNKNNCAD